MNARLLNWMIVLLLAFVSVASVTGCTVEVQAVGPQQEGAQVAVGPVEANEMYKAYGFVFEQYEGHDRFGRFSDHELDVLGDVIEAYAGLVGGAEKLNALVNGPVRVRRDPGRQGDRAGAGGVRPGLDHREQLLHLGSERRGRAGPDRVRTRDRSPLDRRAAQTGRERLGGRVWTECLPG